MQLRSNDLLLVTNLLLLVAHLLLVVGLAGRFDESHRGSVIRGGGTTLEPRNAKWAFDLKETWEIQHPASMNHGSGT